MRLRGFRSTGASASFELLPATLRLKPTGFPVGAVLDTSDLLSYNQAIREFHNPLWAVMNTSLYFKTHRQNALGPDAVYPRYGLNRLITTLQPLHFQDGHDFQNSSYIRSRRFGIHHC